MPLYVLSSISSTPHILSKAPTHPPPTAISCPRNPTTSTMNPTSPASAPTKPPPLPPSTTKSSARKPSMPRAAWPFCAARRPRPCPSRNPTSTRPTRSLHGGATTAVPACSERPGSASGEARMIPTLRCGWRARGWRWGDGWLGSLRAAGSTTTITRKRR